MQPRTSEAYREKEVADIVRDVNRQTHVREMESVAQPYQCQSDDVVSDQFLEILPRLFQLQTQDNGLLRPVAGLKEIIRFEHRFVAPVREILIHAYSTEIPDRCPRHHIQP